MNKDLKRRAEILRDMLRMGEPIKWGSDVAIIDELIAECTHLAFPRPCCGNFAQCFEPCTPRGKWIAERQAKQAESSVPEGWKMVAWAKFAAGEMTHMEMSDGSGADFDLAWHGFVPLYAARQPTPQETTK